MARNDPRPEIESCSGPKAHRDTDSLAFIVRRSLSQLHRCDRIIDRSYDEDRSRYAPATVRKTSPNCGASPLARSNPKAHGASRRKCGGVHAQRPSGFRLLADDREPMSCCPLLKGRRTNLPCNRNAFSLPMGPQHYLPQLFHQYAWQIRGQLRKYKQQYHT
jgi:hypothetical protein